MDIHRRKLAELELREEIRQRDKFLAILSHELRNPMGAIRNALGVLASERGREQSQTDEEGHDATFESAMDIVDQ